MSEIKTYKQWMGVKAYINNSNAIRSIKDGDVWWAAVGENVGVEIDGKNSRYSRPIVILKKLNNLISIAVPLTTKEHNGTWYQKFTFQGKTQTAVLSQTRPISTARLYTRIGRLSRGDLRNLRSAYIRLFQDKNMP
ncbi:type II toxin-antitoxin system PemK/MazF family toxin [Candidatus Saccharibacteria bacterium]|nr:type II toxin-antitoxin system PemK/MazF family toxin [Candidatus Saccharibacteria bacterium]